MSYPNERIGVFPGVAGVEYTLDVSTQYECNVITILGASSGVITVRAIEAHNANLEEVEEGDIRLPKRTLRINGYQLKQLAFTLTETSAFTAIVTQSRPIKTTVL